MSFTSDFLSDEESFQKAVDGLINYQSSHKYERPIETTAAPPNTAISFQQFANPDLHPISIPLSCGGSYLQTAKAKAFECKLHERFHPNAWQLSEVAKLDWRLVLWAFQQEPLNFVSIDFEGQPCNTNGVTQVGITSWTMRHGEPIWNSMLWSVYNAEANPVNQAARSTHAAQLFNFPTDNNFFEATLDEITNSLNEIFAYLKATGGLSLVAHGGSSDLTTLKSMGVDLTGIPWLDTQKLDRDMRGLSNGGVASLGRCLDLYGISHKNLHNAANDSYYTMALFSEIGNFVARKFGCF